MIHPSPTRFRGPFPLPSRTIEPARAGSTGVWHSAAHAGHVARGRHRHFPRGGRLVFSFPCPITSWPSVGPLFLPPPPPLAAQPSRPSPRQMSAAQWDRIVATGVPLLQARPWPPSRGIAGALVSGPHASSYAPRIPPPRASPSTTKPLSPALAIPRTQETTVRLLSAGGARFRRPAWAPARRTPVLPLLCRRRCARPDPSAGCAAAGVSGGSTSAPTTAVRRRGAARCALVGRARERLDSAKSPSSPKTQSSSPRRK